MPKDSSGLQVNLDHLRELAGDDQDFIKEMIQYYLSQVPVVLNEILRLNADKNWPDLGEVAHKAKSSFKFMGIEQLTEDARNLETICREEPDEARIGALVSSIEQGMTASVTILEAELDKLP